MNIHHVIAHELDKKIDDKNAKKIINPKGEFDKNSSILQRFIASTDKSYKRRPKALGNFDPNTNAYPLQILLNNYLSLENKDSKSFIELTEKAMDYLVNAATNIIKATGGIVVFMHYDDSFMILLLSKKTVFNINNFVLEDLEAMDIDTMRYAVKINITEFTKPTPEDPYISFIRGTAQRISEYFLNFIGCKDYIPPAQSTNEMIEAVRDYMSSINYDTETRRNIESQILGYCVSQRKSNKPVYLSAISELVDPTNSEALIIHINDNNIMCSDVFEADPTTLRKLKRYEYRSKKWSLSFDHDLYEGKTITYDKDAKTITIRNVPEDFERTLDLKKNETTNP